MADIANVGVAGAPLVLIMNTPPTVLRKRGAGRFPCRIP